MEFLLPDVGEGTAEGEIIKWHVQPGDTVTEEQDFVEVMTDKASVMIPCPVSGVVAELLAKEGDVVPVHSPIATFSEVTGGKLAEGHGHGAKAAPAPKQAAAAGNGNGAAGNGGGVALLAEPAARVRATPATRKHARTLGVDIRRVPGTGPAGRITRDDVDRAASGAPAPGQPAPQRQTPPQPASTGPAPSTWTPTSSPVPRPKLPPPAPLYAAAGDEVEERVPIRGVRRKIVEQMSRSKHTAAHYTYVEEVNVTSLVALRERMKPMAAKRGVKLTYLAFIVKAVCNALRQHPQINAAMDDANNEIVYKRYYNIGIAADTPNGLVVPALKAADRRPLLDIASEIMRLGQSAREGTLTADDLTGGTFTITSAGHIGGLLATPILNYPEAAIMGVHKIQKRPVVNERDEIVVGHIMYLSLSLDHRVVDGADAARFMNDVVGYLEEPEMFILEGV